MGEACRQLGPGDPQLYKDALRAFDQAADADPGDPSPRTARGSLCLAKYDSVSAREALKAVLERNPQHPGALLAMARAMDFDGERGALALAAEALRVAPNRIEARVYVAEARLEMESYDEAIAEAERALETDPSSLEALSVLAGARYLKGEDAAFATTRDRVLALNPRYADLYNTLAELCVRNRLYRQAVEFASEAVRLDPRSWRGHATLGVNRLRLGAIDSGRASLETAFAGDPYNVWTKNTLDLLDTFKRYETRRVGRLELFVRGEEAALLQPYVVAYANEALEKLEARYGYRVEAPVRVEVFPSHADFSVRTVGLAGLGALGVCFGNVVAIDSPSARARGSFNWASTLWHELAHSVTLGLSGHRVPRWLTEGISVREERRARPGWGDDVNLDFIAAFETGELLPIAGLNDGFVRPEGPRAGGTLLLPGLARGGADRARPRVRGRAAAAAWISGQAQHGGALRERPRDEPRAVRQPASRPTCASASPASSRPSTLPSTRPRLPHADATATSWSRRPTGLPVTSWLSSQPAKRSSKTASPLRRALISAGPSPSSPSTPRTTARAGCWPQLTWKPRTPRPLAATSRLSSRSTRRNYRRPSSWRRCTSSSATGRRRRSGSSARSASIPPIPPFTAVWPSSPTRWATAQASCAPAAALRRSRPRGPAGGPLPARAGPAEAGDAAAARREVLQRAGDRAPLPAGPGAAAAAARRARGGAPVDEDVSCSCPWSSPACCAAGDGLRHAARLPTTRTCRTTAASRSMRVRFQPCRLGPGRTTRGASTSSWNHDYPRAEAHFMKILQELTTLSTPNRGRRTSWPWTTRSFSSIRWPTSASRASGP